MIDARAARKRGHTPGAAGEKAVRLLSATEDAMEVQSHA